MQENALFYGEIFFLHSWQKSGPNKSQLWLHDGIWGRLLYQLAETRHSWFHSDRLFSNKTTLITFNVEIQYFQSTFHKDEVMKTPWLPIMKCYSYLMISNKMYQTLSFDPESNGDTNAPNGIDPAFFQDQVRGEGCWGVLSEMRVPAGVLRGWVVNTYSTHVYIHDKIFIRMDPSTWSLAGGGFGWLRLILRLVNCQSSP